MSENVYQKIMKVREDLLEMEVPKSGKNRFSHYFELEELIPRITKSCSEHGIICIPSFKIDQASLKVVNLDDPMDVAIINSPMPPVEKLNKGTNMMQTIGACETYQRRYMYMALFDIIEKEVIDADENNQKESDITTQKPEEFTTANHDKPLSSDTSVPAEVSKVIESMKARGIEVNEKQILLHAQGMANRKHLTKEALENVKAYINAGD